MRKQAASPHSAAEWARRPERSNMLMLRIMSWISLRLGRAASRAVLHAIAGYFLLAVPAGRAASRAYLARALGRPARWTDVYRHFFRFAATVHDRVYFLNRRFDLFDIEVHGAEQLREAMSDGKGLLLIGAHMGSFEAIRALGRRESGLRVAMAMYEENARKINEALAAINPAASQDIVALGKLDSMLNLHDHLERGALVGMLADRTLGEDGMRRLPFLGDTAAFPSGPFRMAALLRRPVFFMTGLYLGKNRYAVHFEKLADFSQAGRERQAMADEAMMRYAGLLERYCRLSPYNWFNFFDFWQDVPSAAEEK